MKNLGEVAEWPNMYVRLLLCFGCKHSVASFLQETLPLAFPLIIPYTKS